MHNARCVNNMHHEGLEFTVATLVTNRKRYAAMLASFEAAGFSQRNTQFIYIDNCNENHYDAYTGLNQCIQRSQGQYIILCHQDITLFANSLRVLRDILQRIDAYDKRWAVLGNAGGAYNFNTLYRRISDPHGINQSVGSFPVPVRSLDENFLLIKKSAQLGLSVDLSGFHLYGTDLCLQATCRGYRSYVVDFHLQHDSAGNKDGAFFNCRQALISKYQAAYRARFIRTPATRLFLSGQRWANYFINQPWCLRLIKKLQTLISP